MDALPRNSRVLVDANIILYAIQHHSTQCRELLKASDSGAIQGYITTIILAEVSHRRMMQEARSRGVSGSNLAKTLANKPQIVRGLSVYKQDMRDLLGGGLTLESVQPEDFYVALEAQSQYGLLTNDSLNYAVAKRLGISHIASADGNFNLVPDMTIHRPNDLHDS